MISICVLLEFEDETVCVTREAPPLPAGVMWHPGMWVNDSVDSVEVKHVSVELDGGVSIWCEETYAAKSSPEVVAQWTNAGWSIAEKRRSNE